MSEEHKVERREFVRMACELPVKYKFVSLADEKVGENLFEGCTRNISPSGILLQGLIPDSKYLQLMLQQRIAIVVKVGIPEDNSPVTAITRLAWFEAIEDDPNNCLFGLHFKEITSQDTDKIFRLIIESQL